MSGTAPADAPGPLAQLLLDCEAVRFGDFTLASGEKSDVYVDIKRAWTEPKRLQQLADTLAERVGVAPRLAGLELGAVPLVVAVALKTGRPYVVLRKAAKDHGTRQRYEGEVPPGELILLIEDVTTSGASVADSVQVLREAGATVERVLTVVDREVGATARLASIGVTLEALVHLSELHRTSP